MKILKMVEEGKITPEDGAKLLAALGDSRPGSQASSNLPKGGARWLRVRVTDGATGKSKVNVNLPIGLVGVGLKIAGRFAPEANVPEMQELAEAIKAGAMGKIVDVMDDEDGEHVEVFVE
jgi:hypothetical protein